MGNVTPIRKESQHPALAGMRLRIDNLERTIAGLEKELAFLKTEIKKLHAQGHEYSTVLSFLGTVDKRPGHDVKLATDRGRPKCNKTITPYDNLTMSP